VSTIARLKKKWEAEPAFRRPMKLSNPSSRWRANDRGAASRGLSQAEWRAGWGRLSRRWHAWRAASGCLR